jgi:hypothetical protein
MPPNTQFSKPAPQRAPEPLPPPVAETMSASTTRFVPETINEAFKMARLFYRSGLMPKTFYNPKHYPNAEDATSAVCTIILYGAELGLTPMQAIRSMHVIEGVPTLSADLMVALVKRSPKCLYFEVIEGGDDYCTVEAARADANGKPRGPRRLTVRLHWGDVKDCPKPTKDTYWILPSLDRDGNPTKPYARTPGRMCAARAKSYLCRDQFEDVVLGLYSAEEVVDFKDPRSTDQITESIFDMVSSVPMRPAPDTGETSDEHVPTETQEQEPTPPSLDELAAKIRETIARIQASGDAAHEEARAKIREVEAQHGAETAKALKLAVVARIEQIGKAVQ